MPDLPAGTVTLLFTAIEGSTQLLQHLGPHYVAADSALRSMMLYCMHGMACGQRQP